MQDIVDFFFAFVGIAKIYTEGHLRRRAHNVGTAVNLLRHTTVGPKVVDICRRFIVDLNYESVVFRTFSDDTVVHGWHKPAQHICFYFN